MRILYGVSGEGFGHSSRAKVIIRHLHDSGHEVLVMTYSQAYDVLKHEFRVRKINGILLKYRKGKLSLLKTCLHNFPTVCKSWVDNKKIRKIVDEFDPEVCITDMEPTIPIISFGKKVPLISIDNQHSMTNLNVPSPKKYKKSYYLAKIAINKCVPRAYAFIVLSFFKTKAKVKNTFVVSPVLRKEVIKAKPKKGKKILVYFSKEDNRLLEILKMIPEEFVVYGYEKDYKRDRIKFKISGEHFLDDLINCKAIIASSGFSLISEGIYLKKPYFAIPLKGQFEQYENALFLEKSGFGTFSEKPTKEEIEKFILNMKKYEQNLKRKKFDSNEAIKVLDKILLKIRKKKKIKKSSYRYKSL